MTERMAICSFALLSSDMAAALDRKVSPTEESPVVRSAWHTFRMPSSVRVPEEMFRSFLRPAERSCRTALAAEVASLLSRP